MLPSRSGILAEFFLSGISSQINDSSDCLTSSPKLFADDTSLFSIVQDYAEASRDGIRCQIIFKNPSAKCL